MSDRTVRLGFAVGSGSPVDIPIRHLCVTGQTQEAGKTTTLEALITRSTLRALTFVTKRGEGAFAGGRVIAPYFREQADWRFVSSLLEAFLQERLKFERSWIMRATKGARTLRDVRRNITRLQDKAKGLSADVYMVLGEYLDELVPAIAAVTWAPAVDLAAGVNVMDLAAMPTSMQHLVIRSSIEWVLEREHDTVVVVPEAWKFAPQGRGTPVKLAAQAFIRQGAALRNYLWLDSQDIGGIDKEILRSVPVWVLGVQRETNEIKRTLANIPASVAKPKPSDIATLELGEFIACWGRHVITTYVQPAGMSDVEAIGRAKGDRPRTVWRPPRPAPMWDEREASSTGRAAIVQEFMTRGQAAQRAVDHAVARVRKGASDQMNPQQEKKLDELVSSVQALAKAITRSSSTPARESQDAPRTYTASESFDNEALYQAFKTRLLEEAATNPRILEVLVSRPEIRVKVERHTIEIDGDTLRGRLALLIADGFFDEPKESGRAFAEVTRRGFKTAHPNVSRELQELARMGFLTRSNKWYQAVDSMKRNIAAA